MKPIHIKTMTSKRFNAFVGLSRNPATSYFSKEVAWLSNEDETVIGVVLLDLTDNDYAAIALARDKVGRFRAFDLECSFATEEAAKAWLTRTIKWHTSMQVKVVAQGDEGKGL